MGRVFKKGDGWAIDYNDSTGKRHREIVKNATCKVFAKEVLAQKEGEAAERRYFPQRASLAITFNELADKVWEAHGQHLKSRGLRYSWDMFRATFGERKVGLIQPSDIQMLYSSLRESTSVSTANRYIFSTLSPIFARGQELGLYSGDNPCAAVKKGREPVGRLRFLDMNEIERLLSASSSRMYPILACAIMTGMRRGEMLGLRWENVDIERGVIYLLLTKSGVSREVPISPKLRDILEALPSRDGLVFDMPVISFRRGFAQAVKRAGIAYVRAHDLRHTFASHFIMTTGNLPALQKILGHESFRMTQRYAHLSRGHLASEMLAFDSSIPARSVAPLAVSALVDVQQAYELRPA